MCINSPSIVIGVKNEVKVVCWLSHASSGGAALTDSRIVAFLATRSTGAVRSRTVEAYTVARSTTVST